MPLWLEISLPIATVLLSAGIAYWLDTKREAKRDKQQADERAEIIRKLLTQLVHRLLEVERTLTGGNFIDSIEQHRTRVLDVVSELRRYIGNNKTLREVEQKFLYKNTPKLDNTEEMLDLLEARKTIDDLSRASNEDLTTRFLSH